MTDRTYHHRREDELLQRLTNGATRIEAARAMHIAPSTARNTLTNASRRYGTHGGPHTLMRTVVAAIQAGAVTLRGADDD